MKKSIFIVLTSIFIVSICGFLLMLSLVIQDPKPDECVVQKAKIIRISEGSTYDMVFSDSNGDRYYINRGLEQDLNLETLNTKVLNKTVTLHLPKLWTGISKHISQLSVDDKIVFTEFN